uniref:Reverse transcriptase zinc-binding domain-containing protein n=1 Tax=Coccidioides posadasii RMSCC 3488 TaxID=454284 RepID=A0A0J6IBP1_COCPO|nr:hypothetical protein CPAG_05390 [Coccidioides posadasii RMSCC 3488]
MDLERLEKLKEIDPGPLPPWEPPAFEEINIETDRENVVRKPRETCDQPPRVVSILSDSKSAAGPSQTRQQIGHTGTGFIRDRILSEWENKWKTSSKGRHLKRLDVMLPSIHTGRLYDTLPRNRTYLLSQLRTGHSWLASHGKLQRLCEEDKCECGAKETVTHVLIDCPRLAAFRLKLRADTGNAFNNISLMLGGRDGTGQKKYPYVMLLSKPSIRCHLESLRND